jgi:chromosome segregation protein
LAELRALLAQADTGLAQARARHGAAREAHLAAQHDARTAQNAARDARQRLDAARETHADLARRAAEHASRRAALAESARQIAADLAESESHAADGEHALAELGDGAEARGRQDALRARTATARAQLFDCQSRRDRLRLDAERRRTRRADIATEDESWRTRAEGAAERITALAQRAGEVAGELTRLSDLPADIERRRHALADLLDTAAEKRGNAGDALAAAETDAAETERRLRAAEGELSAAREDRVRAEAAVQQAEQSATIVVERIAERLGVAPEGTLALAQASDESELADLAHLEGRLDRLLRERDNMGPVNLRAEDEAAELGEKIDTMRREREDLIGAIAKLRDGIAELNREGRDRLLASFEAVNGHFQKLFTRLFDGGHARLMLTDPDNPLEAGLEIMASPPGKKLQVLSLLSGGERALTALALLFAVFMTNPAPICILDEVDAPLDDANVDRICSLLEEIAHHSATRFLIITHHRMTMARMDRLFGVTMPEAGISQLVSVDLERAEQIRQIA